MVSEVDIKKKKKCYISYFANFFYTNFNEFRMMFDKKFAQTNPSLRFCVFTHNYAQRSSLSHYL